MFFKKKSVDKVSAQLLADIDLPALYLSVCRTLGIDQPPKIQWDDSGQGRFVGRFVPKKNTIFINRGFTPEETGEILVHELTHAVLWQLGYRSVGHSWLFLALFELLMRKCGAQATFIESCAALNWNKLCPWPFWYRHVIRAQQLVSEVSTGSNSLASMSATELARQLYANAERRPVISWAVHRWHDYISDTRGCWFVLRHLSIGLFFMSIALMKVGGAEWSQVSLGMFGCSVFGFFVISKVFKPTENSARDSSA